LVWKSYAELGEEFIDPCLNIIGTAEIDIWRFNKPSHVDRKVGPAPLPIRLVV
jgi:hypothetical protein